MIRALGKRRDDLFHDRLRLCAAEGERWGELVEYDETEKIFTAPSDKRTEDYVTGRFG